MANIFVKCLYNSYKRNSTMLYRDNVHAGKVGYPTPRTRSLTQGHTNAPCCHWLPKKLSNLIRGSKVLNIENNMEFIFLSNIVTWFIKTSCSATSFSVNSM